MQCVKHPSVSAHVTTTVGYMIWWAIIHRMWQRLLAGGYRHHSTSCGDYMTKLGEHCGVLFADISLSFISTRSADTLVQLTSTVVWVARYTSTLNYSNTVARYSRVCMEPCKWWNVLGCPSHGFSLLSIITIPMIACASTHVHTWCVPNSASVDITHTHTPSNVSYRPFSWAHHAVCVCVCSLWTGKGSQHNIQSSFGMACTGIAIPSQKERNSQSTSLHSTKWIHISTVHWVCTHLWHTLSKKCFVHCFQFFRNCVNRCTHVVWHRSRTQCVYMMTQQCACELFPGRSYHLARNISCN